LESAPGRIYYLAELDYPPHPPLFFHKPENKYGVYTKRSEAKL